MFAVLAVVGLLVVALFIFVVNRAIDEIGDNFGIANSADYELELQDCSVDSFDDVQASGTLRNTSGRSRSFSVGIRFVDDNGNLITTSSGTTGSLDPGQQGDWSVVTFDEPTTSRFTCEVSEVTYFGF